MNYPTYGAVPAVRPRVVWRLLAIGSVAVFAVAYYGSQAAWASNPALSHTWNMSGYVSGYNEDRAYFVEIEVRTGPQPWGLALQEICAGQFDRLYYTLRSKGYYGYGLAERAFTDRDRCSWSGNAVFVLGEGADRLAFAYGFNGDHPPDVRNLLCIRALFPTALNQCSTHLATDEGMALGELEEQWNGIKGKFADSDLMYIAGDFNLETAWPGLDKYYFSYPEADDRRFPPGLSPTLGSRKVDYIFSNFIRDTDVDAILVNPALSDHRYVRGNFRTK